MLADGRTELQDLRLEFLGGLGVKVAVHVI